MDSLEELLREAAKIKHTVRPHTVNRERSSRTIDVFNELRNKKKLRLQDPKSCWKSRDADTSVKKRCRDDDNDDDGSDDDDSSDDTLIYDLDGLRQEDGESHWKSKDAYTSIIQSRWGPNDLFDDDSDYYYDRRWGYDCESDDFYGRYESEGDDFFDSTIENDTNIRLSNREMMPAEIANKKADKHMKISVKKKVKSNDPRKDTSPLHAVNPFARSPYLNQERSHEESRWEHYRDADTAVKRRGYIIWATSSSSSDGEDLKESSVLTYEDVKGITITRSKLAKLFTEPFFEELIVGCFVRVPIVTQSLPPSYCLCIVRNVDAEANPDRQYKLENKTTNKYLNAVWVNENAVTTWQMDMVSESSPTKEEFEQLIKEVKLCGGKMPSKQEVLDKADAVEKCSSYVYYAESVKQMFHEKKSTLDVEAEKDQRKHDEVEVEKTKANVDEPEASRQTQLKDNDATSLAEMNRAENLKNVSEVKLVLQELFAKAGEAGWNSKKTENFWVDSEKAEILAQKMEYGVQIKRVERCKQRNLDMEFLRTDISSYPEEVREIIQQQKVKIINNSLSGYYDV